MPLVMVCHQGFAILASKAYLLLGQGAKERQLALFICAQIIRLAQRTRAAWDTHTIRTWTNTMNMDAVGISPKLCSYKDLYTCC